MPRKRTSVRRKKINEVPEWQLDYLLDGVNPTQQLAGKDFNGFLAMSFVYNKDSEHGSLSVWNKVKEQVLLSWIRQNPGKRPFAWWDYDAPRQPKENSGCHWDGKLPEIRKILEIPKCLKRGEGQRRLEEIESFSFGVLDGDYGILCEVKESGEDPFMLVESQAAYLKRHGLLTAEEKRKLIDKDFEPETITFDLSEVDE